MKKPSNLSRLLDYAGGHRYLTYASWVLSAASALLALIPYWYIWRLMGGGAGRRPGLLPGPGPGP